MQSVLKIDFLQSNLLQSRTRDVIIIGYIEKVCTHAYARTHARREMNSTAYAKRTLYKPIDFFFRGVADASGNTKKIAFVDAFQVLNDRYLGRMSVCNYFYIAEGSVRINELNIIALEELVNYDLVMKENFLIPDVTYNLPISTRFLENDKDFDVLTSAIKDLGYKKSGLIISFFVSSLTKLDDEGRARYNRLRKLGYKICATAFGEDYNSLDVFSDFTFDYLRCEAQYFGTDKNKKKVLAMLVSFCKANKIGFVMEGVDTPSQYSRYKREGVKYMTGRGVSKLSRWVTNDMLGQKEPEGEKREQYLKKLQKVLDAKEKAEQAELEALRRAAIEKAKATDGEKVMPSAPRPELAKSPYQVRLEQQKLSAKKATEERLQAQAKLVEQDPKEAEEREKKLITEMSRMRYEGDVQSALALSFASQKKSELGIDRPFEHKTEKVEQNVAAEEEKPQPQGETIVKEEENSVAAPVRPEKPSGFTAHKKPKKIKADFEKEEKLFNEYKSDSLFGGLGMDSGMKGFGVTMHIASKDKDEPDLVGTYNDKGQWVDEDGNVFNGYFDVEGNWVEYEQFDVSKEGSYNENAQWVDKDGNVYDGYFDEEGRWIDYTYTDPSGEIVDNGYFDDKIGKWVPYGYFAGDGTYHKF